MTFQVQPATRSSVHPLIGFYGRSGGGKTLSALLTMRGLVGPRGHIVGIDSENRRMSIFADIVPGGYSTIDLSSPYSPERYWDAIQAADAVADGMVVDSFSHEWGGEGGVLDMQEAELNRIAGDNYQKREACKMAAWIKPKIQHKRLVERLLRLNKPLIVCMRGEEKTHIEKDAGKTLIYTDKFSSPIGDPRFIFELLIHAEVLAVPDAEGHMIGGFLRITKTTRSDVLPLLPRHDEQISVKHGEALARWCAGDSVPAKKKPTPLSALKSELWTLTQEIHFGAPAKLEQWLIDEMIISDTEDLATVSLIQDRLVQVVAAVKLKLAKP